MSTIEDLKDQLAAARAESERQGSEYTAAVNAANKAKRKAAALAAEAAAAPRLFGLFPRRAAREAADEAEAYQAQVREHQAQARDLFDPALAASTHVRELEQQVAAAEQEAENAEIVADFYHHARIGGAIQDDVDAGILSEEEAHNDPTRIGSGYREDTYTRYEQHLFNDDFQSAHDRAEALDRDADKRAAVRQITDDVQSGRRDRAEAYDEGGYIRTEVLESALGLDDPDDPISLAEWEQETQALANSGIDTTYDEGYAEAAADARADQLAVRDLDLSIDAGTRTYEEVYTPEGHIRQHLLHDEEPEQETGRDEEPESAPARESEPRSAGFDFEESF